MSDQLEKNALIGEVHGFLEKLGKSKYWLFEQLSKYDPRPQIRPLMTSHEMLQACSVPILRQLVGDLGGLAESQKEYPPSAEMYHWFFTDIVSSSSPSVTVDDQALKIIRLNKLIQSTHTFRNRDEKTTIILPTGDGNAIGFKDNQEKPLLLGIELQKAVDDYNKDEPEEKRILVRIGLASGNVYKIQDLKGEANVWGEGIILARRVMDLGLPNSILATDGFARGVMNLRGDYRNVLHDIGEYNIKHGVIPVYNVFGKLDGISFGNEERPPDPENKSFFLFNFIEVKLEILDSKSMLTRHTWTREIVNLYDKPADLTYYDLQGDKDRDFADLNVKLTDETGEQLKISRLAANEPREKKFYVALRKPLKPYEPGRRVILQFDWEEPTRRYDYTFGSDCKKFRFLLVAPRKMPIIQRVLRIFPHTGDQEQARPLPTLTYYDDRTEVEWNATDIRANSMYRLDW